MTPDGFDRLRRRTPTAPGPRVTRRSGPPDPEGKRALFSVVEQPPPFGAFTMTCGSCGQSSVLGARQALRLALPSVHLPLLRRGHPSWMRCPVCERRTWVRMAVRF
jgi:hypothetical protein